MNETVLDKLCKKNKWDIKYDSLFDTNTNNLFMEITINDKSGNEIWREKFSMDFSFNDELVYSKLISDLREQKLNVLLNG
jgi:hypothetical protein